MKIKKVVIPVAGLATRMFPATKAVQKGMLPIFDRPIIQYVIEEVIEAGIRDIILIVNEDYETIDKHFNKDIDYRIKNSNNVSNEYIESFKKILDCNINFIIQKEQKGLGDAILCAKKIVKDEDFCVALGDVIIDSNKKSVTSQLVDVYDKYQKTVVAVETVSEDKVSMYGILEWDKKEDNIYNSVRLIEKPERSQTSSNLAMVGRYIVKNEIFDILSHQNPGKNGEIQFTDALNELSKKNELLGLNFDGKTYDVGNRLGYLIANVEFGLKDKTNSEKIKEYLKKLVSSDFRIGDDYEF